MLELDVPDSVALFMEGAGGALLCVLGFLLFLICVLYHFIRGKGPTKIGWAILAGALLAGLLGFVARDTFITWG